MLNVKVLFSVIFFSLLLVGTSFIKNQSREIEKKINKISKIIHLKKKDLNYAQLDFFYLSSPSVLDKKIENLDLNDYLIMNNSRIFSNVSSFLTVQNKLVIYERLNGKKYKKNKNLNINQSSFYFEDYIETNKKNKFSKDKNFFRIEFIYFFSYFFL